MTKIKKLVTEESKKETKVGTEKNSNKVVMTEEQLKSLKESVKEKTTKGRELLKTLYTDRFFFFTKDKEFFQFIKDNFLELLEWDFTTFEQLMYLKKEFERSWLDYAENKTPTAVKEEGFYLKTPSFETLLNFMRKVKGRGIINPVFVDDHGTAFEDQKGMTSDLYKKLYDVMQEDFISILPILNASKFLGDQLNNFQQMEVQNAPIEDYKKRIEYLDEGIMNVENVLTDNKYLGKNEHNDKQENK